MAGQQYTGVDTGATADARAQMADQTWWKPASGEGNRWGDNLIRIMPPHQSQDGKLYWGVPLHFGVGPNQAIMPCPRKAFQQPCPVCAAGFSLRNAGKEEAGNDLLPSWAGYMCVVPIDEEGKPLGDNPKIRIWSASGGIMDDLLDILEDPKKGDFTNLEQGFDINVRKRGSGKKGTKYQTVCAPEPSAFPMPELAEGVIDLTKISPFVSIEVMQAALEGTSVDPMLTQAVEPAEAAPTPAPAQSSRWGEPPSDDDEAPAASEPDATRTEAQERLKESLQGDKE